MASGPHLTSKCPAELLSEQQLSSLIPPSLRYLLVLATQRYPRYLLRVLNSFDEVYAIFQYLIERYYLTHHSSSYTENFYSLKRERVILTRPQSSLRAEQVSPSHIRETLRLKPRDVRLNLLLIVLVPYLKRKLDESYDIHIAPSLTIILGPTFRRDESLPDNPTLRQRLFHSYKYFLRHIYPSINATYYLSTLAFSLAYLSSHTPYSSPFLWLIGSRIRRMGAADHAHMVSSRKPPSPSARPAGRVGQATTSILNPFTFANTITPQLFGSLKILLPASIFALKFLEWWHASDFGRQLAKKVTEGLVLPPPLTAGPSSKGAYQDIPVGTASDTPMDDNKTTPPISATTYLPILTVPLPSSNPDLQLTKDTPSILPSELCPICTQQIHTPTACQTGFVYCYPCIFRWVEGSHDRQESFMLGGGDEALARGVALVEGGMWGRLAEGETRNGKWEDGRGRDAVTGLRVLGGVEGLRRVRV